MSELANCEIETLREDGEHGTGLHRVPYDQTRGLGMGLSISRSIVENHFGRLWVTTHDGPGASFTVLTIARGEQ